MEVCNRFANCLNSREIRKREKMAEESRKEEKALWRRLSRYGQKYFSRNSHGRKALLLAHGKADDPGAAGGTTVRQSCGGVQMGEEPGGTKCGNAVGHGGFFRMQHGRTGRKASGAGGSDGRI